MKNDPVRPLWKLLLEASSVQDAARLSCADCLDILEYLVEMGLALRSQARLPEIVRQHLVRCAGCQAHVWQRLAAMEALTHPDKRSGLGA